MRLIIGNKNYSSWSLRAWLALAESGARFEERRIPLFVGDWKERILQVSGAGRVPVLMVGEHEGGPLRIHDTAAILEYLAESVPGAPRWPEDPAARIWARSICAEMHSGFFGLRGELPMNVRARFPTDLDQLSDEARADVDRILEIWAESRERYGDLGPWLVGERSIADFVFAPVVSRFLTYGIGVPRDVRPWTEKILGLDSMRAWIRDAAAEREKIPFVDEIGADRSARKMAPILPGRLSNRFQQQFGLPSEEVQAGIRDRLGDEERGFIRRSPFVVMATADASGACDASPRGGEPGFVTVIDESHLELPELTGNRLFHALFNIDQNPRIGLVFLVPGVHRALRVDGRAWVEGPDEGMDGDGPSGDGPPAAPLRVCVEVEEAWFHCRRLLERADLWNPEVIRAHGEGRSTAGPSSD